MIASERHIYSNKIIDVNSVFCVYACKHLIFCFTCWKIMSPQFSYRDMTILLGWVAEIKWENRLERQKEGEDTSINITANTHFKRYLTG